MSTRAYPIDPGKISGEGLTKLLAKFISGSGVVETNGLKVSPITPADLKLQISGSTNDDTLVIKKPSGGYLVGWNLEPAIVDIDPNTTGVTKTDAVVAYFDLTAGDEDDPEAPEGLKFMVVRKPTNQTGAVDDSQIDTAVGHAYWHRLANQPVIHNAPSISSGTVDTRGSARLDGTKLKAASVSDASLANGKIARRKGGSASNWNTAGTTDYDVSADNTVIQVGAATSSSSAYVTVTFPVAFTQPPIVIATGVSGTTFYTAICEQITATDFRLSAFNTSNARVAQTCQWVAIGR